MEADIKVFINSIREKTGIEFSVYDSQGEFIAGNGSVGDTVPVGVDGVEIDTATNKTYFSIKYKSKSMKKYQILLMLIKNKFGKLMLQMNFIYLLEIL